MNSKLIKDVIDLIEEFENESIDDSKVSIDDFKKWIANNYQSEHIIDEPNWEGKDTGRKAESVINTLIVHMNRYAKSYSKSAIFGSEFSTQEDFIYLITLKSFGSMTKMDLIKKNVHEKPAGMQIINRLIAKRWVTQTDSELDKRSKFLEITEKGLVVLENQMDNIRKATHIVTGNLTSNEKMELIRILRKLEDFHQPIYHKNIESQELINIATNYLKQ